MQYSYFKKCAVLSSCSFICVFPDVSSFMNWNTLEDEELVVSFQSQESVGLKEESRMNVS